MSAVFTIRITFIAAALALGLGSGGVWAVSTDGMPPEPDLGSFAYNYESSLGGTFHPSHDLATPSLADLAEIGGPPIAMFTLDADSPGSRFEAIPEPAASLPLLVGILGLGFALKRRRRR